MRNTYKKDGQTLSLNDVQAQDAVNRALYTIGQGITRSSGTIMKKARAALLQTVAPVPRQLRDLTHNLGPTYAFKSGVEQDHTAVNQFFSNVNDATFQEKGGMALERSTMISGPVRNPAELESL